MSDSQIKKRIPREKLEELEKAINRRRVKKASRILSTLDAEIDAVQPDWQHARRLLDYLARWIDFDPAFLRRVESVADRFKEKMDLYLLRVPQLAHLENALGLIQLHHEEYDLALRHFTKALEISDWIEHDDLSSVSRYNLARCYWKQTDYDKALDYAEESKRIGNGREVPERVAATELMEGWIFFLLGRFSKADECLGRAAPVLLNTDDWINHGNVWSFRGRLARAKGRDFYDESIENSLQSIQAFERLRLARTEARGLFESMQGFEEPNPRHQNEARSHANIAFVFRLKARDALSEKWNPHVEQYIRSALNHLNQAEGMYDPARNHRGLGSLHNIRALVYFDQSRYDKARSEIREANKFGEERGDHLVTANSRILRAMIEHDDGSRHSALTLVRQAVRHAELTTNHRLKIRAYIWLGIISIEDPFYDVIEAQESFDKATRLLSEGDRDYLYEDLSVLGRMLADPADGDPVIFCLRRSMIVGSTFETILHRVQEVIFRESLALNDGKLARAAKGLGTSVKRIKKHLSGN